MSDQINEVKDQYKILRLFEGPSPGDGWHKINGPYTKNEIDLIPDPEGASDKKEITSIPSPFARVHLVKQAFETVSNKSQNHKNYLDGETIYHKLVSDALDIGEILFNYNIYKELDFGDKLELRVWDKATGISTLKNSGNEEHKILGDTLDLFLRQDGNESNFDQVHKLYFLVFNHKIIGGTSPITLYFTCANDLTGAQLKHRNDVFFDESYFPLYKRGMDYQRYLWGLFLSHPELKQKMREFWQYLEVNRDRLQAYDPGRYDELMAFINSGYDKVKFSEDYLEASGGSESVIEILANIHHRINKGEVSGDSDFAIHTTKFRGEKVPLALQQGFGKRLSYMNCEWNPSTIVPAKVSAEVHKRILPDQTLIYPWLTVSDFLEPYLVRMVYPIDRKHFFDGNPEGFYPGDKATRDVPDPSYLIPIKPLYFKYFGIQDLNRPMIDKKPTFRMVKMDNDAVKVELRIPIKKGADYVLFERIYTPDVVPSEEENIGAIVENKVSLGFIPFVKPSEKIEQRIALIDSDLVGAEGQNDYNLSFLDEQTNVPLELSDYQRTVRSNKNVHAHNCTTKYYSVDQGYSYIQVSNGNADQQGLIIPFFKQIGTTVGKEFLFAVDFGTTNTHIEYAADNEPPQPFDITEEDIQLVTTYDDFWSLSEAPVLKDMLIREYIPLTIGDGTAYKFPQRTAVSEIAGLNHQRSTIALGDINIPFAYEKINYLKNTVITTRLKWSSLANPVNENRVEAFLETIFILIRNKVLLNGGDVNRAKLVWFYPSSMSNMQRNNYKEIWGRLFKKYFYSEGSPETFSESEVPFYSHSKQIVRSNLHPVVNIDIGGGTTDIVVFKNDRPQLLTSVKFAGNAIFGDAYHTGVSMDNGFVQAFSGKVAEFLEVNEEQLGKLSRAYQQMIKSRKFSSSDILAFFFSFDKNKEFRDANLNFSVSRLIKNNANFRVVFLVFYSAIVYHIAQLMKRLQLDMPSGICLSGNGAKVLRFLDSDRSLGNLNRLSKLIFEKVYSGDVQVEKEVEFEKEVEVEIDGQIRKGITKEVRKVMVTEQREATYHSDGLKILLGDKPKEATCKGGLIHLREGSGMPNEFDTLLLLGDQEGTIVNEESVNYKKNNLKYNEITADMKESVAKEVEHFIDFLFELHEDFSFSKYFDIPTGQFDFYKEQLKQSTRSYLDLGLSNRLNLSNDKDVVAESLFFYPLIGTLYNLTKEIANNG